MSETLYDSRSELAHPRRFLSPAASDLLRSVPVGWQLFRAGLRSRHRRTLFGRRIARIRRICVKLADTCGGVAQIDKQFLKRPAIAAD